ncbi:MAG: GNAT family N-acetyltransferase [Beijerinckiaceae bacterium]|nr:GNAT family N-acetyltransferase [Beijerinckiaceae bacterium]
MRDATEIRPPWDDLLKRASASVYQTPAFVLCWGAQAERGEMMYVIVSDEDRPLMLMPLSIVRNGPVSVASFPAGKHANFNLPVFDSAASARLAPEMATLLKQAGREAGINCFALMNQPRIWLGVENPLAALGGEPSPSFGSSLLLDADADRLLARIASKERRRKLRQKQKWLQALGDTVYFEAASAEEAQQVLNAYFEQKSAQFLAQGIPDAFADDDVRGWLHAMAIESIDNGSGTLRLFALRLAGRIVAVWAVGVHRGCASGMLTSHVAEPDIARTSPGELLLEWMIRRLCAEGCIQLDFGVGEARYKSQWSDATIPLFDAYLGVSPLGRAAALAMRSTTRLKRRVKQSERLSRLVKALRRLRR